MSVYMLTLLLMAFSIFKRRSQGGKVVGSTLVNLRCRMGTNFGVKKATPVPLPIRVHSVAKCGPAVTITVRKGIAG